MEALQQRLRRWQASVTLRQAWLRAALRAI
jgi:hypothetical protein